MKYHQLSNCYVEAKTKEYQNRRFLLQQHLGSGSEGAAYLANAENWGNNPQQVVIKIQKNMKANERDFLIKLIQYQNQYENGNNLQYQPSQLIKIYDFFEWKENQCIIMEVGQENLYEYIGNKMDLSMEQRVKICFQICQPIYFLHSQKLVHRDIKPENYIKVGDIFKLIDFGLIRGSISDNKTQQVGSAIFQAPEILENSSSYTEKVDIWSLGCVFYEILSTQPLFDGQTIQQVLTSIRNHKNQPFITNNKIKNLKISSDVKEILIKMIQYQDHARPTIEWVYLQFQQYYKNNVQNSALNQQQIGTPVPQIQCNPQPSNQILPSSQISIQNSLPNQPPQDNQKITLEQIFSKLNLLENQVKEKDNQIQALSQNLENIVYLQQVEKDNQKQQLQRNLDEQNKQNLNQIDSLKQQVNQEKLNQNIILEEKLKQFEQQITAQQTKIQEIDKRSLSKSDLNFQNQKVVTEQQNLKSKQEDKYKLELTKAISEQETKYKVELKTVIQEQEDKYKEALKKEISIYEEKYKVELIKVISEQEEKYNVGLKKEISEQEKKYNVELTKAISEQEDKYKDTLKKEISEQISQMQKIFQNQLVEIKQNFIEQLSKLNQNQMSQIIPQIKIEQENNNAIIEIKTIVDEREYYKTQVNSFLKKIQEDQYRHDQWIQYLHYMLFNKFKYINQTYQNKAQIEKQQEKSINNQEQSQINQNETKNQIYQESNNSNQCYPLNNQNENQNEGQQEQIINDQGQSQTNQNEAQNQGQWEQRIINNLEQLQMNQNQTQKELESSTYQNIQNTTQDLNHSLALLTQQYEHQTQQQIREKQFIFQQIKQYTSMMFQDFINLLSNQDSENEHNINNNSSNQELTQDQQTLNQSLTQSQDYPKQQQLKGQEGNIANIEQQIIESSEDGISQNLESIQEYKDHIENLKNELLKQVNQYNQQHKDQINVLNKEISDLKNQIDILKLNFIKEQQQSNEQNIRIENRNKDLSKQLQDLTKQLQESKEANQKIEDNNKDLTKQLQNKSNELQVSYENNIKIENSNKDFTKQLQDSQQQLKEFKQISIKENQSLKQELENLQKKTQEDKVRQGKEVDELKRTIKELQEKDKKQNLEISTQNKTLQEFEQQIKSVQIKLDQEMIPLNKVKALTDFFRNPQNLKEFSDKYYKEYMQLVENINSCC